MKVLRRDLDSAEQLIDEYEIIQNEANITGMIIECYINNVLAQVFKPQK